MHNGEMVPARPFVRIFHTRKLTGRFSIKFGTTVLKVVGSN